MVQFGGGMESFDPKFLTTIITFVVGVIALTQTVLREIRTRKASEALDQAEEKAFSEEPERLERKLGELAESHLSLAEQASNIESLIQSSRNAISMGRLFNLYSKQIEKYQDQTRSRASASFIFAIISMVAGIGFVFWGGAHIIGESTGNHVVAGSAIAAIGGGISAFIAKTFLDVHKLSLNQLNRYFKQPVINEHILMAQRLADTLDDPQSKNKAYDDLIQSVTEIIKKSGAE